MTQKQAAQLARAIEIATRDALQVVPGKGHNGQPVYLVASRSHANRYRVLYVAGGRIVCECPAHANGRVCAHAAAVRQYIERERAAATVATPARPAHETAPLHRSNAGFSIWK